MTDTNKSKITPLDFSIASAEALAHAIYCKRCQKHYIKIIDHTTQIQYRIIKAMTPNTSEEI